MLKWLQELPSVACAIVFMNRPPSTTAINTTHIRLTLALVERLTINKGGHHGSGACDSQNVRAICMAPHQSLCYKCAN